MQQDHIISRIQQISFQGKECIQSAEIRNSVFKMIVHYSEIAIAILTSSLLLIKLLLFQLFDSNSCSSNLFSIHAKRQQKKIQQYWKNISFNNKIISLFEWTNIISANFTVLYTCLLKCDSMRSVQNLDVLRYRAYTVKSSTHMKKSP